MAKRFGMIGVALGAIALILLGFWKLHALTDGLVVTRSRLGDIPVTIFRSASTEKAPVIVVAHGFAGSQQLMQPIAVTLARNGYIAVTFDFAGHDATGRRSPAASPTWR